VPACDSHFERALGATEQFVTVLDRACSLNFVMVARLSGQLSEAALREALDVVTRQHALLRARLAEPTPGQLRFQPGAPPLPLVVEQLDEQQVTERAATEAATPLAASDGPLVRCSLLRHGAADSTLLITFHHALGDATSGAILLRDLLRAVAGASPEPRPVPTPLEALLPAGARGWRGWWGHLRYLGRMVWRQIVGGLPRSLPHDRSAPIHERRIHLLRRELEPDTFDRLLAAARAAGTTIHGALAAGLLFAVHRRRAAGAGHYMFASPIDLRGLLKPSVGDEVGLYVTMAATFHRIEQGCGFWDLASDVRARLTEAFEQGDPLVGMPQQNRFFAWIARRFGHGKPGARRVAALAEGAYPPGVGLSNIGRVAMDARFGPVEVTSLGFCASVSVFGPLGSFVATLNRRLVWYFGGMAPLVSPETLRAVADEAVRQVLGAIDVGGEGDSGAQSA